MGWAAEMSRLLEAGPTTQTTRIDGDANGYLHVCEGRKKLLARPVGGIAYGREMLFQMGRPPYLTSHLHLDFIHEYPSYKGLLFLLL